MDQKTFVTKVMAEIKDKYPDIPAECYNFEYYLNLTYSAGGSEYLAAKSRRKVIIQMDKWGHTLQEFPSAAQAGRTLKINKANIANVCNGRGKTAGNYGWKWKGE